MSDQPLMPIEAIAAAIVKLLARCDALEIALQVVVDSLKIEKLLQHLNDLTHQKRLEQAENESAGLAARIDYRTEYPEFLD